VWKLWCLALRTTWPEVLFLQSLPASVMTIKINIFLIKKTLSHLCHLWDALAHRILHVLHGHRGETEKRRPCGFITFKSTGMKNRVICKVLWAKLAAASGIWAYQSKVRKLIIKKEEKKLDTTSCLLGSIHLGHNSLDFSVVEACPISAFLAFEDNRKSVFEKVLHLIHLNFESLHFSRQTSLDWSWVLGSKLKLEVGWSSLTWSSLLLPFLLALLHSMISVLLP